MMRSLKYQGGWFSAAIAIGGALLSNSASRKAGKRSAEAARKQAEFDKRAAGQRVAVGQREALEETRQAAIKASRAVAVAAAGGYAVGDIENLIADIEGEGVYNASLAMYEAETEAEKIRFYGLQSLQTGLDTQKAKKNEGLATLLNVGASIYAGGGFG